MLKIILADQRKCAISKKITGWGATQAPPLSTIFQLKFPVFFSIFPSSLGKKFRSQHAVKTLPTHPGLAIHNRTPKKSFSAPGSMSLTMYLFLSSCFIHCFTLCLDSVISYFRCLAQILNSFLVTDCHTTFFYLLFYLGHIYLQHMRITTTFARWNFLLFSSLTLLITTYFHLQKIQSFNYPRAFLLSNLCCPWPIWREKPWEQGCQLYVQ